VAVLEAFTGRRSTLTLSDVAERVGLGTSTTHRLLRSLVAHGLLKRDEASKAYSLGPTCCASRQAAAGAMDLRELARPVMVRLRDAAGETVGLHLLRDARHRVVVDQVESHQALRRTYTELGEPIPLHQGRPARCCSRSGRRPTRRAARQAARGGEPKTIVDPDVLRAELDGIRGRGYGFSHGERVSRASTPSRCRSSTTPAPPSPA
jgi:IclR family transcriptional regulator, acetate operon repressor